MPDKCTVPSCTSNYGYTSAPDPPYIPVFKLTALERVHAWLQAIHREK